jgi:hypothetical protein
VNEGPVSLKNMSELFFLDGGGVVLE